MKKNLPLVHIIHPFNAFFTEDSKILIVGSFPSVKSREERFYYGNPRNRFWKVIEASFENNSAGNSSQENLITISEKKDFLLKHKIALYDSIKECSIFASSDSSICNVVPAQIGQIVENSKITKILANGKTAAKYFEKFQPETLCAMLKILPSTSPANANYSLENLISVWKKELSSDFYLK